MRARETRQTSIEKVRDSNEYQNVIRQIAEAASNGEFQTEFCKDLITFEIQAVLEYDGYEVINPNNMTSSNLNIWVYWDKKND